MKDKDAVERAPDGDIEMISDVKFKVLTIPAPEPGNIIGYEYEVEERPFYLQDTWDFQEHDPVRESHYSLQLPAGCEFKASWLNHAEVKPTDAASNLWQWTVSDVKGIRHEPFMPPRQGIAGQMVVTFFPPGGKSGKRLRGVARFGKLGEPADSRKSGSLTRGKTTSRNPDGREKHAA